MKYDEIYRKFISTLWEYQMTLKKAELTEKLMKQIYDLSAGIPAYIVKIFQEAQTCMDQSGTWSLEWGFFLLDYKHTGKRIHKSRAESRRDPLSCVFAERKIRKQKRGGRKNGQDMII